MKKKKAFGRQSGGRLAIVRATAAATKWEKRRGEEAGEGNGEKEGTAKLHVSGKAL